MNSRGWVSIGPGRTTCHASIARLRGSLAALAFALRSVSDDSERPGARDERRLLAAVPADTWELAVGAGYDPPLRQPTNPLRFGDNLVAVARVVPASQAG